MPRRYVILGLLFLTTLINYMDRQTVAVLKPTLKAVFGLTDGGYANIINAFTLCYALAYMFSGWVVDRLGSRRALSLFIGVWSLASAGCGMVRSATQLIPLRGLLGLAEPGNFPAALRAITQWFPAKQRGFATGFYNLGTIFCPLIIALITTHFGWRAAFIIPGIIGGPLAIAWWIIYRDNPAARSESPAVAVGVGPAHATEQFAWSALWGTRTLWGVVIARFISDPVIYFVLFWMPGYLQEKRGLSLQATGWVGWLPSLAANVGGLLVMMFSDRLVARGIPALHARKCVLAGIAVLALSAPFIPHVTTIWATIMLFCLVSLVYASWLFGLVLIISDAYPAANVGSICGISGATGAIGAAIFNYIAGGAINGIGLNQTYLILGLLHPLATLPLLWLVRKEIPPTKPSSLA